MDQQQSIDWVATVKASVNKPFLFQFRDENKRLLMMEWKLTDIFSAELAAFKNSIADMASQVLAPIETSFLKSYPDAVSQEIFLIPCMPLFSEGIDFVDWHLVQEKITLTIKQFYLMDLSQFDKKLLEPLAKDVCLFATIKACDTKEIIGWILCSATPSLPFGDIKLIHLVIAQEEQNRGLEKQLLSSMFHIIPDIERIFCYTRPTDALRQDMYQSLGFSKDLQPFEDPNHKINSNYLNCLQYKRDESDVLERGLFLYENVL